MSNIFTKIGEKEIICPHCGYNISDIILLNISGTEYGECQKCHKSTYSIIKSIKPSNSNAKCPYCNSMDTKKISATSKIVNATIFGVFSLGKISKQWHCNKCNSNF